MVCIGSRSSKGSRSPSRAPLSLTGHTGRFRTPSGYGALMSDDDRVRVVSDLWGLIRGLTPDNVRNYPAAVRAIDAGADPVDVVTAMSAAAYEATFGTLF